jgi:hypothetical protein
MLSTPFSPITITYHLHPPRHTLSGVLLDIVQHLIHLRHPDPERERYHESGETVRVLLAHTTGVFVYHKSYSIPPGSQQASEYLLKLL